MTDDELLARADAIAGRAYAPYSNFTVGCAVLCRDGTVVEGVNVENGAYPLGVCAERTAFSRAIVEGYRPGDFVVAAEKALEQDKLERLRAVDIFLSERSWDQTARQMNRLINRAIKGQRSTMAEASSASRVSSATARLAA